AGCLAGDQQVTDLVKQSECADLTRGDTRDLRRPGIVHPLGDDPDRSKVGDGQVATDPEKRVVDGVPLAGGPADMEVARTVGGARTVEVRVRGGVHRRRMARAGERRQPAVASVGRSAATCSIARRSSSSPAGSNSYD